MLQVWLKSWPSWALDRTQRRQFDHWSTWVKNIMPMPFGKINSLRASYYFYGSLLGRYGQTCWTTWRMRSRPPIRFAFERFAAMGALWPWMVLSMKLCDWWQASSRANIYMDTVSVGATINTICSSQGWRSDSDRKCGLGNLKLSMW